MSISSENVSPQNPARATSNNNFVKKLIEEFISPSHTLPYRQSVIVQRSPREIMVEIFRPGFMENVIPKLRSFTAPTSDKSTWFIQYGHNDSKETFGVLTLKMNSLDSVSWRFDHKEDVVLGAIQLSELAAQRGTLVNFISSTELPHDSLLKLVKNIFTNEDEYTLHDVVKRFKSVLESGQLPTTVGQTHGNKGKES